MSHYQRYTEATKELLEGRKNETLSEEDEDKILDNLEEWWYMLTPKERTASEEFSNTLRKKIDDE